MTRVRLEWDGKSADVPRRRLPLQVVETVNSPRANKDTLFDPSASRGPTTVGDEGGGWRNRLIWGDNLHVLSSLADELAGQIDLIYIDPPFDSRQDYKVRIGIGDGTGGVDEELAKISSIVEEKAYRDTWGSGVDSYLQMLYQRIVLLRELLSDHGSLFLHLAPNVSHYARAVLDEVFGPENFRAEIIWQRVTAHSDTKDFGWIHDSILCFAKSDAHSWNPQFRPYDDSYIKSHYSHHDGNGRRYRLDNLTSPNPQPNMTYVWRGHEPPAYGWRYSVETMTRLHDEGRIWYPAEKSKRPQLKRYLDDMPGMPLGDVWDDIHPVNSQAQERLGYDTQKPVALLERIIRSSSDEGSIVLDCFAGSGTTAAVAEKLGRRWIAVDIGRFAIHTTRKRLLAIPGCKPFDVANLGRYERQVWAETTGDEVREYLNFIVDLYGATPVPGFTFLHGSLGKRAVHVGAVDAAVSHAQVKDALDEAQAAGFHSLDVLGWEFELGLHEIVQDDAKASGVSLLLRRIPNEVMDPRTIDAGEVIFHELAHVAVQHEIKGSHLTITLTDFALPNPDLVSSAIREKIQTWSDYIDYWAVDFTFGMQADDEHSPDTFRNSWQSYRTKADRSLDLTAHYYYEFPEHYTVQVKVVDVFGNDTTTSVPVTVT